MEIINNPRKSKRGFTGFRREFCVCNLVCIGVSFDNNTLCNFVIPAVNYCHYECGSTKVTFRSKHAMYRYSPSHPTIYNKHPPLLIISIIPQNIIDFQHKRKDRHPNRPATVQLHYGLQRTVTLKYKVSKCRIYLGQIYAYIYAFTDSNIYSRVSGRQLLP